MHAFIDKAIDNIAHCTDIGEAKVILASHVSITKNIDMALDLAINQHIGQYRKSGEEYVVHPVLVASLVALFDGDEDMIISAILHDVVEDTSTSIEDIHTMFGHSISLFVEGLTKIDEIRDQELIPSSSTKRLVRSALTFRKMLVASVDDTRILVIKLCDRLHNMLTLDALTPEKQKRISEETLFVYAPIAHRLGISAIKNRLEDLSFYYVMPDEYAKIDAYLKDNEQKLQLKFNTFVQDVETKLLESGFIKDDITIYKRIKHYYSIYLKMQRKGINTEEVLDLLAIRVIVQDKLDCYKVLGVMHLNFRPIIGRFKDYITLPKENGYQTIHTTVFSNASIIEVQIRTAHMHHIAEFGVAAHWKYKSGTVSPNLDWIKDIHDRENDTENIEEYYELGKIDLFSEDIMVYSPVGDVYSLPRGSTVLDFAYAVHTEIGDSAVSGLINKTRVPLLAQLSNSQIVKIITGDEKVYRCSWENSVKTSKAKNNIRQNCRKKRYLLNEEVSFSMLCTVFSNSCEEIGRWVSQHDCNDDMTKIATDEYWFAEVVNQLKDNALKASKVIDRLKPNRFKLKKTVFDNIEVISNLTVKDATFDYCCHPKVGDDIMGIKKGTTVTVHHKFCEQAQELLVKENNTVFVQWGKHDIHRYRLLVTLENKKGALASFLFYLAKIDINILSIGLKSQEGSLVDIFELEIELNSRLEQYIKEKISKKYTTVEFVSTKDAYKS